MGTAADKARCLHCGASFSAQVHRIRAHLGCVSGRGVTLCAGPTRSVSASCLSVHRRQVRTTAWRRRASPQRARDALRGALQFLICDVACHVIAVALRNAVITARRKRRYNAV